ncbi:serine/threonine-protein kinase [Saccharothrix variisporea]|uniref:Serine/threonine protein kinase n=1 Tax=Saccharothrix variisporea TaxID=543527 RepID=A0A495XB93_9PSEU|nr:serine/threonine-protein kinase [Saccharothrix variisporea]RKT70899.1 serine/threonine protein kinase [Saccharothrix variisporea]
MTAPDAGTELDPGRVRPDHEPDTELDPGRTAVGTGWARVLPAGLAQRFEVVRDLTGSGRQGDVYLVRVRDTDEQLVLKAHRPGWRLDERVVDLLVHGRPSRHVVAVHEVGEEDGRWYEVMEHLAGGTLAEWRRRHPAGVDSAVLVEVVRQLAEGLDALHRAGVVHRDVKPANLLIRALDPLELVIADLGISRHLPDGEDFTAANEVGTVPYVPPEFISGGRIVPAFDWWSLGVTVLELATGHRLFEGVDDVRVLRARIGTRPIRVDVADDRVRLLCSGLLAMAPEDRWGSAQVAEWLAGGSPPIAAVPVTTAEEATEPYVYLGEEYRARDLLAATMTENWGVSRAWLFGDDPKPLRRLHEWLEQFPGLPERRRPGRRETEDVKLLHELRAVDPTHPPWYRGWNITPARLPELADEAVRGVGAAGEVVHDLWRADLLPLLATGRPASGAGGGDGLAGVRERWHRAEAESRTLAAAVPDAGARAEVQRVLRQDRTYALSLALLAATATGAHRLALRRTLDEQDRELRLPWFSDLVARAEYQWIAFALIPHATRESARIEAERAQREAYEKWIARTERQREWSRRQNRPQALGYAATGVAAVAVALFALVGFSDVAGVASDAQVLDAWFAVVAALAVVTVAESLLAWDAGGRFHPAYSFLGAGAMALGRVARGLIARRIAVPVVLAFLAVLGLVTVVRPVVAPAVVAAVTVAWAVQRHLAWRAQDRRERDLVADARSVRQ